MTTAKLDLPTRVAVNKAVSLVKIFRAVHKDMPLGAVETFMHIVANEGISVTELSKLCEDTLGSTSRYVQALGVTRHDLKPGLGLVVDTVDPLERRKKVIKLTALGRIIASQMLTAVSPKENGQ